MKNLEWVVLILMLTGCDFLAKERLIKIQGSETMLPLMKEISNEYNSSVGFQYFFQVEGGGSQMGFQALWAKEADFAMVSNPILQQSFDSLHSLKQEYEQIDIALDEILIIVNGKNIVTKITLAQLKEIFLGKITNWKQLGGANVNISVFSRKEGSGSLNYFKEAVMNNEPFSDKVNEMNNVQDILAQVTKDSTAISFVGGGHFNAKIKVLDLSVNGIEYFYPSKRNVLNKSYPLAIPLSLMYDRKNTSTKVLNFIDYLKSRQTERIIVQSGFLTFSKDSI